MHLITVNRYISYFEKKKRSTRSKIKVAFIKSQLEQLYLLKDIKLREIDRQLRSVNS